MDKPLHLLLWTLVILLAATTAQADDPLPSWNDGPSKRAIIEFVTQTTMAASPRFIPVNDRLAVFDNDGTLWSEKPYYSQIAFVLDRVKALAPQHPEWKQKAPFKYALEGNLPLLMVGGTSSLTELVAATHGNLTTDEFDAVVRDWTQTARHPRFNRLYTELVFQPMLETLTYLRANGYKTYVVSGGGVDFMRAWAPDVYGIPPEQIIGSGGKTRYELREGKPVLMKLPEVEFIDDRAGKPVAIQRQIGRRPVMAFGNSDGDFEMLEWTTSGPGPRLGMIIHHTDAEREWEYDRASLVGQLSRGLDEAPRRGWFLVDMKTEWNTIYPFQK